MPIIHECRQLYAYSWPEVQEQLERGEVDHVLEMLYEPRPENPDKGDPVLLEDLKPGLYVTRPDLPYNDDEEDQDAEEYVLIFPEDIPGQAGRVASSSPDARLERVEQGLGEVKEELAQQREVDEVTREEALADLGDISLGLDEHQQVDVQAERKKDAYTHTLSEKETSTLRDRNTH